MDELLVIQEDDLPSLRKLYEVDKPLHVITTVAIAHFMGGFKSIPEWTKIVGFYSLNDNWRLTGTFVMVNTQDDHILFNTLEPAPYESLRKTLELLNYDKPMVFICFRDIFRNIVLDVIRVRNLEITFDSGTKNVFLDIPKNRAKNEKPPEGFYFDSLNQSHVELVNSFWPQRHLRSNEFISKCIALNPSTGLFDEKTGELVAWIINLETGSAGNLYIKDKYRSKRFAEAVLLKHTSKVNNGSTSSIAHQNDISLRLSKRIGGKIVDNNSWIGVRKKKTPREVPLWGHL